MEITQVTHEFKPIFDETSRVLMLGTMPSPKSREVGFYYGHPRNRFWKVVSAACGEPCPETKEEKIEFALRRGAEDGSIRNPVPNDMDLILKHADIQAVFATGAKAAQLYKRHCYPKTGIPAVCLPSTSPANCRTSYEELCEAYRVILPYIKKDKTMK